jgi:small subunit ribosomal protein S20
MQNLPVQQLKSDDSAEQKTLLPKVSSMIDKLAKKGVIHKNKARNLKSKLAKRVLRTK